MTNMDKFIIGFDHMLRTMLTPSQTLHPVPVTVLPLVELSHSYTHDATAPFSYHHCGDICGQTSSKSMVTLATDDVV